METETTFRDYTGVTTEQMVVQQLTENTGRALCDSGDAYGRNWQRNQGQDLSAAPAVTVSWDAFRARDEEHLPGQLMLCGTVDLYHWMTRNLEFDAELQAQLDEFAAREENEDSNWLQLQEEFADYLHDREGHEAKPRVINTYNDPDNVDLSQVLQYVELYTEDRHEPSHLIVSVHGGCDVRGGYTSPVVYRLRHEYYEALDAARVSCAYTSDFSWDFSAGGSCNGCSEGAPVEDVFALPAFTLDWIADSEIDRTIETCRRHIQDAEYICGLSAEAQARLVQKMEDRIAELEKERFEAAVQHLVSNYEASVLVDKGRAWLIDETCWEAEYVKGEMELKGGNWYF